MIFHFSSNIFLQMDHGFKVTRIYLSNRQTEFIVEGDQYGLNSFQATISDNIISFKYLNPQKMRIFTITESDYRFIKSMLENNSFKYQEKQKQTVQKSLCAKIYMKFYTGKL